jgi:hypothetical protein
MEPMIAEQCASFVPAPRLSVGVCGRYSATFSVTGHSPSALAHAFTGRVTALAVALFLSSLAVAGDGQSLVVAKQPGSPLGVVRFETTISDSAYTYGFELESAGGQLVRGIEWGVAVLDADCHLVLVNVKTEQILPRRPLEPDLDLRFAGSVEMNEKQAQAAIGGSQFFYLVAVEFLDYTKWQADAQDVAKQLESCMEDCDCPRF